MTNQNMISKFECALFMFRATVVTVTVVFLIYSVHLILHDRATRVIEMCGVWYGIDCDGHATEIFKKDFREHLDNSL
jgi:hypothetical protein